MTIPLDSSDLSNHPEKQSSQLQLESSSSLSYEQQKEELLLKYQAKATDVFQTIRETYPSFSVLDGQNIFLILSGLVTDGNKRKACIRMLSDNLDAELQANGILPKPEKQEDSSSVSPTA